MMEIKRRKRNKKREKKKKKKKVVDNLAMVDRALLSTPFFFSGENRINDSSTICSPAIHRSNCLISSSIECVDKFLNRSVIFILFYFNCIFFFFWYTCIRSKDAFLIPLRARSCISEFKRSINVFLMQFISSPGFIFKIFQNINSFTTEIVQQHQLGIE